VVSWFRLSAELQVQRVKNLIIINISRTGVATDENVAMKTIEIVEHQKYNFGD